MHELSKLHIIISKLILVGVSKSKTTDIQIAISQKRDGLGLRKPKDYKWAAELSALEGKKEIISKYFTFMDTNYNYDRFINIANEMKQIATSIGMPEAVSKFDVEVNKNKMKQLQQLVIQGKHPNNLNGGAWERLRKRWLKLSKQYRNLNLCRMSDDRILSYAEIYNDCIVAYEVHHNNMIIGFNKMVVKLMLMTEMSIKLTINCLN